MEPLKRRHVGGIPDRIKGVGPDAAPRLARRALGCQQLGGAGAIVAKRVDPGQPATQHFMLKPHRLAVRAGREDMRENAAMPVLAAAAMAKRDRLAEHQCRKRRPRLFGKRPCLEIGATQWQLRRLDAGEPHLPPIAECQRVAIDDLDRLRDAALVQRTNPAHGRRRGGEQHKKERRRKKGRGTPGAQHRECGTGGQAGCSAGGTLARKAMMAASVRFLTPSD